jgi:hypothetical protein
VTFTPNAAALNNYEGIGSVTQTVNVAVWQIGDIDKSGAPDVEDIALLIQYLYAQIAAPTGIDFRIADIDGDDTITTTDVMLLLQIVADLI